MNATRSFNRIAGRVIAVLIGLLVATAALAQYGQDRGQWQILGARYGTADRNIDVTQTLRSLAQQDTTFRITNRTFGSDPAPGMIKSLRIYARGPKGATRMFEYVENDVIDGTQFTGWSSGSWGQGGWDGGWGNPGYDRAADIGQWRILGARYGTPDRNVDVTERLRSLAKQDAKFKVTNKTFGNDPAPGVIKTLRIYARGPGGATRTFEYGENHIVDGAIFTGWRSGDWGRGSWNGGWGYDSASDVSQGGVTIVGAQYGYGSSRRDVTYRLRSLVRDGRIAIRVDNDTMGGDPAPGRPKQLWVSYYVGGRGQQDIVVAEKSQLALP
jgi:hypothetical protein